MDVGVLPDLVFELSHVVTEGALDVALVPERAVGLFHVRECDVTLRPVRVVGLMVVDVLPDLAFTRLHVVAEGILGVLVALCP